ncbi:MAG: glycosyltransferase family 39 protein [Candidatus Sumerlaeia bacterium]|nr:glycosyltransferase family 39 protein [Candidatus Sumerlaeia bacterium]
MFPGRNRLPWQVYVAIPLAMVWFAITVHGALNLSAAMDEVPHVGSGLAIWEYRDYRMNPEHPPLFKMLATLPLHLAGMANTSNIHEERELLSWFEGSQWAWGYYTLFLNNDRVPETLLLVRIVPILTCFFCGILAWFWAVELAGRRVGHTAGLIAFVLLLYNPEFLGHGRYVTFDVPTAFSCGLLLLLAWRCWKRPGWLRLSIFAVAAGTLSLVKLPIALFSVFILLTAAVLLLVRMFRDPDFLWVRQSTHPGWTGLLVAVLLVGMSGWFFQWAGAGFRFALHSPMHAHTDNTYFLSSDWRESGPVGRIAGFAHEHRILPETTVAMLNLTGTMRGRVVRLFDEENLTGWRHYFLVTIFFKTPVSWLVMLGIMAVALVWRWRVWRSFKKEKLVFFLLPFILMFLFVSEGRLNIGHRHVLFVYFPWVVLMGVTLARAGMMVSLRRVSPVAAACLMLLTMAATLRVHPGQAVYFNMFAGGSPHTGSRILDDSNIDWGQDLPQMAEILRERGYDRINLAYFGSSNPRSWGIDDFNFIIRDYPLAVGMPEFMPADPDLPTVTSLVTLRDIRMIYLHAYEREPIARTSSLLLFAPLNE